MENNPQDLPITIDIKSLKNEDLGAFIFIDLREDNERTIKPCREIPHKHMPLSKFQETEFKWNPNKRYIFFCAMGQRSLMLTEYLREQGKSNIFSLIGGVDAIKEHFKMNHLKNPNLTFQTETPLSQYTTFHLGAHCQGVIHCQTPGQLEETIYCLAREEKKFILIGSGSNLVVSDHPLDCYVVRYCTENPIISLDDSTITVSGSTPLDQLVFFAAQNGLEGINFMTGIPGTVGGAITGNAGAWGKQIADALTSAELISPKGIKKNASNHDLHFTYRNSILKQTSDIVIQAKFKLKKSDTKTLLNERKEIARKRLEKHPDLVTEPCAGSFFRNIEPTSLAEKRQAAGWFLEQAGGKNLKIGGAVVYSKHANIIIKTDGCRAQDVYDLSIKMSRLVKDKFNLDLIREVQFVGKFHGMPPDVNTIIW